MTGPLICRQSLPQIKQMKAKDIFTSSSIKHHKCKSFFFIRWFFFTVFLLIEKIWNYDCKLIFVFPCEAIHQNGLAMNQVLLGLSPSILPGPKEGDLATHDIGHEAKRMHSEKGQTFCFIKLFTSPNCQSASRIIYITLLIEMHVEPHVSQICQSVLKLCHSSVYCIHIYSAN